MSIGDIAISKEDFDGFDWTEVPASLEKKACSHYYPAYFELARAANEAGHNKLNGIYVILGGLASLLLQPDERNQPFTPLAVLHTGRSAILDDFSNDQINVLSQLIEHIQDCELRARIADVVWVRKRDYKAAEAAIGAYLESAQRLEDPQEWTYSEERIRRALKLAVSLGRKNKHFPAVIQVIKEILSKYNGEDPLWFTPKLMQLLIEFREGDLAENVGYCEHAARHSEGQGNWRRARDFWESKAALHDLLKQDQEQKQAKLMAAETHVKEAEHFLASVPPNYINASYNLKSAAEAIKRIGGQNERLEQVYAQLLEVQKISGQNLQEFSQTVDLSKEANETIEKVRGKDFSDALISLATCARSPRVGELKSFVDELVKAAPLASILSQNLIDEQGRVIGRRPPMMFGDADEMAKAVRDEMFRHAITFQGMYVVGVIEPGRRQITSEHHFGINDFSFLVLNNPFIPPGREAIFAQGFYEGLSGNFVVAVHLLMPQLENSLRYLLSQAGVITSMLTDDEIQEDYMLGKLLYTDELKAILGEDIVFDLQGLLVEKFGSNLRNRLSHGMLDYSSMHSYQFIYFWWLMLRLCVVPTLPTTEPKVNS